MRRPGLPAQERELQVLSFEGSLEREWRVGAAVRYVRVRAPSLPPSATYLDAICSSCRPRRWHTPDSCMQERSALPS
jgi:hypothetical protein